MLEAKSSTTASETSTDCLESAMMARCRSNQVLIRPHSGVNHIPGRLSASSSCWKARDRFANRCEYLSRVGSSAV